MATGYIDTNGVYRYGEDDEIPTLSSFLDLGQAAQSAQFSGLKSRVGALEGQTQVPVLNGRYTNTTPSIPTGTVTAIGTMTAVTASSSTGASTLWTPIASGLTFRQRGLYLLSVQAKTTGGFTGRCFFDLTGDPKRFSWTSTGEDTVTLAGLLVITTANTNVAIGMYQNSGAAKAFVNTWDVARLGALS